MFDSSQTTKSKQGRKTYKFLEKMGLTVLGAGFVVMFLSAILWVWKKLFVRCRDSGWKYAPHGVLACGGALLALLWNDVQRNRSGDAVVVVLLMTVMLWFATVMLEAHGRVAVVGPPPRVDFTACGSSQYVPVSQKQILPSSVHRILEERRAVGGGGGGGLLNVSSPGSNNTTTTPTDHDGDRLVIVNPITIPIIAWETTHLSRRILETQHIAGEVNTYFHRPSMTFDSEQQRVLQLLHTHFEPSVITNVHVLYAFQAMTRKTGVWHTLCDWVTSPAAHVVREPSAGPFGHGVYLALDLDLALEDAEAAITAGTLAPRDDQRVPILMVRVAVTTVYPITVADYSSAGTRFFGQPLSPGFDAHVALVHRPQRGAHAANRKGQPATTKELPPTIHQRQQVATETTLNHHQQEHLRLVVANDEMHVQPVAQLWVKRQSK